MYSRLLQPPARQSFFLSGPRGTGKTAWVRRTFPDAPYFDLLDAGVYTRLLAAPEQPAARIPGHHRGWVVVVVLYGERGLLALEVKRGTHVRGDDLRSLRLFREDFL